MQIAGTLILLYFKEPNAYSISMYCCDVLLFSIKSHLQTKNTAKSYFSQKKKNALHNLSVNAFAIARHTKGNVGTSKILSPCWW